MRIWREFVHGLRRLMNRSGADRDDADEVRHFLEEAEAELVASGMPPGQARRQVRLTRGDELAAREDLRVSAWEGALTDLGADVRLAVRRLRRSPGFTTGVTATLGLGIGAATAIFSAVRPVLLDPLPYPDGDRILAVDDRADDGAPVPVTFGSYRELSERTGSFAAMAVHRTWQPTLTGGAEPERLDGQRVSADFFEVLRVRPAFGPGLDPEADRPGGPAQAVLSDGLWRRRFGADPAAVGRTITLDGAPFTVVGVMAPSFHDVTLPSADLWAPLQYDSALPSLEGREWGHHLGMVARMRDRVAVDDARAELAAVASRPVPEFVRPPWATMGRGLTVRSLRDAATAGARPLASVLAAAVALLLAIACVNVGLLLLARGLRRRGEMAMRSSLGAGRGRLLRHLLVETFLLAGLGGAAGVGLSAVILAGLAALAPPELTGLQAASLDGGALGFAAALTLAVGLATGLLPAYTAGPLQGALAGSGRGTTSPTPTASRAMVVAEVALAMVLLVGAGLVLRSTERLLAVSPGFDPSGVVALQIQATGLPDDQAVHAFFDGALEAVRAVPGVGAAAFTSQLPLSGDRNVFGVRPEGADPSGEAGGSAYRYAVTLGYLDALGTPVLRGRGLSDGDGPARSAVLSESLAARLFADADPLGMRVVVGGAGSPPFTVVGVAADVKQASLEAPEGDGIYVSADAWHWADRVRWLVVDARGDPGALVPELRRAIWSVDAGQPVVRASTMVDLVAASEVRRRFVLGVLGVFSLCALVLAGVGLYGVQAGRVAERMPELGVRAALGASRRGLVGMVVRQGLGLTVVGVGAGLVAAAASSAVLSGLLFEVSRVDPTTYFSVATLLLLVSALANWVPARRAARVDPVTTLHTG